MFRLVSWGLVLCLASALNLPQRQVKIYPAKRESSVGVGQVAYEDSSKKENILATTIAPSIGVLMANGMFLTSLPAVLDARTAGSLGALNPVPWAFIFANCVAWVHYSFVIKNKYAFLSNSLGVVLGLFFTITGMQFGSPDQRKMLELILLTSTSLHLLTSFGTVFLAKTQKQRQLLAGYFANIILIIFYAAPLSTLAQVLATKSAASIYAPLSIVAGINSALWVIYGLAIKDFFLAIPNGAGLILAIVQLSCKFMF